MSRELKLNSMKSDHRFESYVEKIDLKLVLTVRLLNYIKPRHLIYIIDN